MAVAEGRGEIGETRDAIWAKSVFVPSATFSPFEYFNL